MDITKDNDALSQPTRARLFEVLCDLRRPAPTDELARSLDRHPNGVRIHLEQMRKAGLLVRERERHGRGRPRDLWAVDPTATPGGVRPTAYAELSRWLANVIGGGPVDPEEIEGKGHEIGLGLAGDGGREASPETRFRDALAAMGFQPTREAGGEGNLTICLNNCPYRDVVREQQPLICAMHRGITAGLLESIDDSAELAGFEVRDPDRAGCRITIRGDLAASAAEIPPPPQA